MRCTRVTKSLHSAPSEQVICGANSLSTLVSLSQLLPLLLQCVLSLPSSLRFHSPSPSSPHLLLPPKVTQFQNASSLFVLFVFASYIRQVLCVLWWKLKQMGKPTQSRWSWERTGGNAPGPFLLAALTRLKTTAGLLGRLIIISFLVLNFVVMLHITKIKNEMVIKWLHFFHCQLFVFQEFWLLFSSIKYMCFKFELFCSFVCWIFVCWAVVAGCVTHITLPMSRTHVLS